MPPKRRKHTATATSKTIGTSPPSDGSSSCPPPPAMVLGPNVIPNRSMHDQIMEHANNAGVALSFVRCLHWVHAYGSFHPVSIILRDALECLQSVVNRHLAEKMDPRLHIASVGRILMMEFKPLRVHEAMPVRTDENCPEPLPPATQADLVNAYVKLIGKIQEASKNRAKTSEYDPTEVTINTAIECLDMKPEDRDAAFLSAQRWHSIAQNELADARLKIMCEIGGVWDMAALEAYERAALPPPPAYVPPRSNVLRKRESVICRELRELRRQIEAKPRAVRVMVREPFDDECVDLKSPRHVVATDDGMEKRISTLELIQWKHDACGRQFRFEVELLPVAASGPVK